MKISVVIPTYNSARVIAATLDSVLKQTVQPEEILVLDDGSTDETVSILSSYQPRITLLRQQNKGVAHARNTLAARATGDLVAFLDHDDLWHPDYLKRQSRLYEDYPDAAAFFSGHVDFNGYGTYEWPPVCDAAKDKVEVIDPLNFLRRYNETTGVFGSMSYCCIPKRVLTMIGDEPFRVSGVDDSHLCTLLPLLGQVVLAPSPMVAYRLTSEAQSANRLKSLGLWVTVFEILEDRYAQTANAEMCQAFRLAFASKRRWYGKLLMGAGEAPQARKQFTQSMLKPGSPASSAKSFLLLSLSLLPPLAQPAWPESSREVPSAKDSSKNALYAVR